jgi:hypothetical protein
MEYGLIDTLKPGINFQREFGKFNLDFYVEQEKKVLGMVTSLHYIYGGQDDP